MLSRCLAVLPDVALLSEINPLAVKIFPEFDPLYQDRHWLHLLDPAELETLAARDIGLEETFRDAIRALHDGAGRAGRRLILRDYNYVDFMGVPFIDTPPRKRVLYGALPEGVEAAAVAFLRHPVDQWLSLCKHEQVRNVLPVEHFLAGYAAFLEDLGDVPLYRYEDFLEDPSGELRAMCASLNLDFDPSFTERFHEHSQLTGDFTRQDRTISAPAKREIGAGRIEEFRSNPEFRRVLERAGYDGGTAGM